MLSRRFNNTYLYDTLAPFCNVPGATAYPQPHCRAQTGGWFDESVSPSWHWASNSSTLPKATETLSDHQSDVFGNDTVHVNSTLDITGFPLGVNRGTGGSVGDQMNSIGLGTNSTILNALVSANAIASRTWGYSQGWAGAEAIHQVDGSLVLGGYDAAQTKGKHITLPFARNPSCVSNLVVNITNMKMNLKNGSDLDIFSSSAGNDMQGCISPDYPLISLSENVWNSFVSVSGSRETGRANGTNFRGMLISKSGA